MSYDLPDCLHRILSTGSIINFFRTGTEFRQNWYQNIQNSIYVKTTRPFSIVKKYETFRIILTKIT